jgi:hypothetical protein
MKRRLRGYISKVLPYLFPKFRCSGSPDTGLVVSAYHAGVEMLIYSLSSFFYFSKRILPLCIYEDGSLTKKDEQKIYRHFGVSVKSFTASQKQLKKKLRDYKHVYNYRFEENNPHTKNKLDCFLLSPFKRTIYLEADTLFFDTPKEIVNWIDHKHDFALHLEHARKYFKADSRPDTDYVVRAMIDRRYQLSSLSFNSGLLCYEYEKIFDLDLMNDILGFFNSISYSRCYCAEEVLISILFNRSSAKAVSAVKYLCPTTEGEYEQTRKGKGRKVLVHFIAGTKRHYSSEGIKVALSSKLFGGG